MQWKKLHRGGGGDVQVSIIHIVSQAWCALPDFQGGPKPVLSTANTTYHLERYIKTFNTGKNISVHTQYTHEWACTLGSAWSWGELWGRLVGRLLIRGRGKIAWCTLSAHVSDFPPNLGKPDILLGNIRNTKRSCSRSPGSAPSSLPLWWASAAFLLLVNRWVRLDTRSTAQKARSRCLEENLMHVQTVYTRLCFSPFP